MIAKLSTAFGLLALALTCIGLYGLMAYRVAQRTGEIGIRMALGASRLRILWMVGRHEVGLIGAGLLLGLPLAVAGSSLTQSLLFGVTTTDPGTLVASALVMTALGLMASVIPVRRATAIQPTLALRHE
jgi:ABC-type antimicrobial peptide transport system permease subunit